MSSLIMVVEIATTILLILCSLFSNGAFGEEFLEQPAPISTKVTYEQLPSKDPTLKFEVESNIAKPQGRKHKMLGINHSPREHCRAVVRTKNVAKKFMGAGACVTIYKPKVQNNQWSSSRIKLLNGGDSIEAGWMVNPKVFEDNEAHLYAKFSTGGRECINQLCPGFVDVSDGGYLGSISDHYTTIGTNYYWETNMTIDKHQDDGHWWLSLTHEKYGTSRIGYWPKSLFSSSLAEVASQVEWGGEINNPGASASQPEMGNGYKTVNFNKTALFRQIRTVNEGYQKFQPNDFEVFEDCSPFYTAEDYGYYDDHWGHLIFFGGTHQ
ncbi:hypothetical protein RND81_04G188900 [Saponaria officinalis]|uniref:Neprosin PEP catalytic domain-containing protein n=1 Tax=Saponaria officinalis TaxID=3572 RepID=A0AAW1LFG0_SAPOF